MAVHCRACPCHKGAAPTEGTHRREGAIEVVGHTQILKAAPVSVLGERQRGQQAHKQVEVQLPAAGVREEGAGSVQGAGGWRSVVVLQQGLAGHTAHHPPSPPLPPSSYRKVNFVIASSAAGTVPSMWLPPNCLQCTAPSPTASPPTAESCPRTDRQGGVWRECQFGGSEVPPSLTRLTYMDVMCPSAQPTLY
jgi:hypothetical protein